MANIQPVHSPCYCVNFRHAANILTKYYDEALAEIQLTANQFFLLVSISQLEACNKSELAQYTRLDRTTIIRNLGVLRKKDLVEEVPGETKRNNLIRLSERGSQSVAAGMVIWERLQAETQAAIGEEALPVLWQLLERIDQLAGS